MCFRRKEAKPKYVKKALDKEKKHKKSKKHAKESAASEGKFVNELALISYSFCCMLVFFCFFFVIHDTFKQETLKTNKTVLCLFKFTANA